jgi:hypothetical protein
MQYLAPPEWLEAAKKFKRKKPLDPLGGAMLHLESRSHVWDFRDRPAVQVRAIRYLPD